MGYKHGTYALCSLLMMRPNLQRSAGGNNGCNCFPIALEESHSAEERLVLLVGPLPLVVPDSARAVTSENGEADIGNYLAAPRDWTCSFWC